jgi:lipopolysaccharide transport protein LptA
MLAAAAPLALAQSSPIVLDADSTELDRRSGHVIFTQVRIEQAGIVITAARAESANLDFGNTTWRFSGDVRIDTGMGAIRSASADLAFRNHRLVAATAMGSPARFRRDVVDGDARTVTGTAGRIRLDAAAEEIELTEQAVVRDGAREVSGGRLVYQMAEDRLIASADKAGDERVRIVISPPEEDDAGDDGQGPP